MASNLIGWELLYHSVENVIEKKEDILVVLIHWVLIKNGYKCIGLGGDTKDFTGNEATSELLPKDWNKSTTYGLRYVNNKELFILRGVTAEDDIVFNFVRVKDDKVSSITVKTNQIVKALKGPLSELLPTYHVVIKQIGDSLLTPVDVTSSKAVHTQTTRTESTSRFSDPLQVGPVRQPERSSYEDPFGREPERSRYADPLGIGRSDLDPLGSFAPPGSGGMIFDPFPFARPSPGLGVPGGLPRGAVPPGARFDPIGPDMRPPQPRRPPPDSDHFPPPGYDDMFM